MEEFLSLQGFFRYDWQRSQTHKTFIVEFGVHKRRSRSDCPQPFILFAIRTAYSTFFRIARSIRVKGSKVGFIEAV